MADPAIQDAATLVAQALALTQDAGAVLNSAYGVLGQFGRYAAPVATPGLLVEADALAAASVARHAVSVAGIALTAQATLPGAPAAVQSLLDTVSSAIIAPADRLRAYEMLALVPGSSSLAVLARRLAVIALCRASRNYIPSSFDDAQAVLLDVTDALDIQITAAGDADDDASYDALRALRRAVVADLTARGASLAPLVTRTFGDTLPQFVMAQLLYNDARRADEIVRRVDPVHPLFMPVTVQVLGR